MRLFYFRLRLTNLEPVHPKQNQRRYSHPEEWPSAYFSQDKCPSSPLPHRMG